MIYKDIVIIGGGASGMMCAIKAKEKNPDKSVVILEKQDRIGRKLLSTGNGRCNLCNEKPLKKDYHGSFARYYDVVANNMPAKKVLSEFSKNGLLTKTESEGRVYPISNHASSVLDVLRYRLENLNVEIICNTSVQNIKKNSKNFDINTDTETYSANKVVIATGSLSAPKLGGNDSGLNILQKLGHSVNRFYPALSPINVKNNILNTLKGLRVQGKVSLFNEDKLVKEEYGEIQFTEKALSGICVFNLSTYLPGINKPTLRINLLPHYTKNSIIEIINKNKNLFKDRTLDDLFTGIFQKKLGIAILKIAGIAPLSRKNSSLSEKEINKISDIINNWEFTVDKNNDFNKSQAACGGVVGNEIDANSMESKIVKNLYICGECVDIVGNCGGYNLYFAFASGIIAGEDL
ncbi:MAG: aminoacetone oxidase family FAD-binding enzyme [Ruminococcus sp.]|nr:aminoacetone oxidase family FAD-binding enzyme [Ruminococcus sp.]